MKDIENEPPEPRQAPETPQPPSESAVAGRHGGLPAGEIVLSTAGETVTVTVAGAIDVRLVVALRKVLLEAATLAPATLRLHLLVSVDGAELIARIVRDTQARLLSARPRFLVATPDPAVLRLLRGARIIAELQPVTG